MKVSIKILWALLFALLCLILGVGVGSVSLSPDEIMQILTHKILGFELNPHIDAAKVSILWSIRLPRAILAFIVGAALAVSGAVMQSVLKNPLASSFTLGVSSGASLGAGLVLIFGFTIPLLGSFSLPFLGLTFGVGTVFLAVGFAARIDPHMENQTVILTGMVFSLFINAIVTMMMAISREMMQRLVFWQMGSFSLQDWNSTAILMPFILVLIPLFTIFGRELDILTFGEDQALIMGVDTKKVKWILLGGAACLTGAAISFVGVVGFIDLIVPHLVRRLFGSLHRVVIPMSAVIGGGFMVLCDLAARTVAAPAELPVGAVTALLGAPFFAYVYFKRRPGAWKSR